jgi:kynurenine formamidase/RimJ/RimL family protein N-acetyltransferase
MDRNATTAPSPATTLTGTRIRLEPLRAEHVDELAPHAVDPALWAFTQQRILSRHDLQKNVGDALAERDKGLAVPFVVREIATGRAIGSTRYMNIDAAHRRLEIGWSWLGTAWHGTGVNAEMKLLMLRHAFEELGFVRVEFKANAQNARSRAALRKLGAREEGVFRKWRVGADGRTHDTAWYSILDTDWPAVKAALGRGTRAAPPAFLELSHAIEDGMVTYKGLPAPLVCDYLSREASRARYEPGTEFQIGKIEMVANTGTYVDSPFHRYADGPDVAGLPLDRLANLDCVVARVGAPAARAITRLPFTAEDVRGRAVLVHTGWARHWRTDRYFEGHPYLAAELAEWLVGSGASLVGIDSFNIDCTDTGARPVHSALLRNGIPIVEHLCGLDAVPERGTRFFAVPPKVVGLGSFPVRAFVM